MKAVWITAALATITFATLARPEVARADDIFKATLTGDQEVPPVDTIASGNVKIRVNADGTAGEFTLTVYDGTRAQQAHIHCGAPGQNGPVVIFLAGFHALGWDVDGEWVSNATFTDDNMAVRDTDCGATLPDFIAAMRAGKTYANVHTIAHPGGEIRGLVVAQ